MNYNHQNVQVITVQSNSNSLFDTCCCCIPLKTGCLILGYLELVSLILQGIYCLIGIGAGLVLLHGSGEAKNEEHEHALKLIGGVAFIYSCVILVLIIISLPFTIALLVGLHKERRNYIKCYLVFAVVSLVLQVIYFIEKFSRGYSSDEEVFSAVIEIPLNIYFLVVLRSQYIKMGNTNYVPTLHYRDGQLVQTQKYF